MNSRRIFLVASLIVLLISAWVVSSSIYISKTRGTLQINSSSGSLLTITQANHQAKIIGTTRAKVLLAPGDYQVAATNGTKQNFSLIHIRARVLTRLTLIPTASVRLASPQDIQFSGTDKLVSNGLTSSQVSAFKLAVFNFKHRTQTAAIDTSSVVAEPHSLGANFVLDFNLTLDGTIYKASISYSGLSDINLSLYNFTGNRSIFNSGVISL